MIKCFLLIFIMDVSDLQKSFQEHERILSLFTGHFINKPLIISCKRKSLNKF